MRNDHGAVNAVVVSDTTTLAGAVMAEVDFSKLPLFGRWKVLGPGESPLFWKCECQCAAKTVRDVNKKNLKAGLSLSCRCLNREAVTKHGMCGTKTYIAWESMRSRCNDPKDVGYCNYGAIGVKVCDRWQGENGFKNFLEDVGECPSPELSLDRFPVTDGNYEPGNVRWATRSQQQRGKRNTKLYEYDGRKQCAAAWAEEWGMTLKTFSTRMERGWSMERIKSQPVGEPRGASKYAARTTKIEHNGRAQTAEEWAAEFDMPINLFLDRFNKDWTMEQIRSIPFRGHKSSDVKEDVQ